MDKHISEEGMMGGQAMPGAGLFVLPRSQTFASGQQFQQHAGLFVPRQPARSLAGAANTIHFTDHGGAVIQNAHVHLIFWGSAWGTNSNPSLGAITGAVITMLTGSYMNSLNQYRGIQHGSLIGTSLVISPIGNSPANPPNPFPNGAVEQLIRDLIGVGMLPQPASDNQLFYCVIMPQGVASDQGNAIGEHTYFYYNNVPAHYAWVMNFGTLGSVTTIFSHELVETCTDPEGSAILGDPGTCSQGGWCEIGDVCESNFATVDGVLVQRYWSQADNSCVVPADKAVKDDKDNKEGKDHTDQKNRKDNKDGAKDKEVVKDNKDGAKDKEVVKDHKDGAKDTDNPKSKESFKEKEFETLGITDLGWMLDQLSQQLSGIRVQLDTMAQGQIVGRAFITDDERPSVGDQALNEPLEVASAEEEAQLMAEEAELGLSTTEPKGDTNQSQEAGRADARHRRKRS